MRLTSKGRYAVRLILDLAKHSENNVTVREICGRQKISQPYAEQLMGKFARAGAISVQRGPGGGYQLKHESITIREILLIAGEEIRPSQEGYRENDRNTREWKACKKFFAEMDNLIVDYLNTTVGELLNKVQ